MPYRIHSIMLDRCLSDNYILPTSWNLMILNVNTVHRMTQNYYRIRQVSVPHLPTSLSGQIRKFHPVIKVITQSRLLGPPYSPDKLRTNTWGRVWHVKRSFRRYNYSRERARAVLTHREENAREWNRFLLTFSSRRETWKRKQSIRETKWKAKAYLKLFKGLL